MQDYQATIDLYKKVIEDAKTALTKAETNLEQLDKQQKEIEQQMQELGVTPETIEQAIKDSELEADRLLQEAGVIVQELKAVL